ncbi:juvenile hormone acid methyltransferase [Andrena cerasifolii]|uniref:juvenile hormone acid methyltransferase n=1 Tax=Andrena cerasifolii TaxID=2819439 RepID=UPI0040381CC2
MYMPEEYLNASKMQYDDASETVKEFEKELSQIKGKCLDIGCGPGHVTHNLVLPKLHEKTHLVGADISQKMIDYASQKYRDEKRLSFITLDIQTQNLPQEEVGQYNGVFSFYCLHWCNDIKLTFENVYKLLRPGGKALVMFLGWNDGFDAYERLAKYPQYKSYMEDVERYMPFFHRCEDSRATMRQMLEEIGFEVLHCSKRERSSIFMNLDALKEHMVAVNPFITRFPDDLLTEYQNDLSCEVASRKIRFQNKINDQQEYSILDRYHILVTYFKKP